MLDYEKSFQNIDLHKNELQSEEWPQKVFTVKRVKSRKGKQMKKFVTFGDLPSK